MRRPAAYLTPTYHDPKDRRLVQIIKRTNGRVAEAVNLLGVPFDGAVLGRRGAAGGPAAIRQAMSSFSNYNPELGLDLLQAKINDLGDVVVPPDDVKKAHLEVEGEVLRALGSDSLLVLLGGDNSISLPSLGAFGRKFGRIGLVTVDSHFDLRGEIDGNPTSGSSYGLAIHTINGLSPMRVAEIGIHGFLNSRKYAAEAKGLGVSIFTASEVRERGALKVARDAMMVAEDGADAVYLSIDLDAVDLAYVSGVSAPSVGGISAGELFEMMYYFGGKDEVKCADIVELAPSLDLSGRSQVTAGTSLVYLMAGFASR